MSEVPTAGADARWRQLTDRLWTGTVETRPIGTVERGRRYAAIDADGVVVGRCRTLGEAQQLLTGDGDARHRAD